MKVSLVVALLSCLSLGQTTSQTPTVPNLADANPDVVQIAIQDQWDRGNDLFGGKAISQPDLHGRTLSQRDEDRRAAIEKLLAEGKVKSGTDLWLSALIFQHSPKSGDVMRGHILAVAAVAKG